MRDGGGVKDRMRGREHRDGERQLRGGRIFQQRDPSTDALHLTGLKYIGDDVKALGGERLAGLPKRRRNVFRHRVALRSEGLEDRLRTGLLGEPHNDRPEPVRDEQDDEPSETAHGHGRLLRRLDRGRSGGRQHPPERFEQLPVGRAAVRSLRQHDGEAPPEQRIAHGVGGELQGERDEP